MLLETAGFGDLVEEVTFSEVLQEYLRATCDRFLEARFFARQAINLEAREGLIDQANWYISAHMAAVIGIRDAAKADFAKVGKASAFNGSDIAKEFFLRSDAPRGTERDPLAVNKAYRDLRNLRVHYAIPLVVLDCRTMIYDFDPDPSNPKASPRFFMRPIDCSEHRLLTKPQLSSDEIARFNEWLGQKTLGEIVYQHLLVLSKVIQQTEKVLA